MTYGHGMQTEVAVKSGNAEGAKVCTVVNRGWANILHTQRWEEDGK